MMHNIAETYAESPYVFMILLCVASTLSFSGIVIYVLILFNHFATGTEILSLELSRNHIVLLGSVHVPLDLNVC